MDPANSVPREKLRQLVLRFGKEIGKDARRCEALLRDVCGSYRKEIFALVSAVREGIPTELQAPTDGMPLKVFFARCSERLHENLGISKQLCEWSVETWAYALSVVNKKDLLPVTQCPSCNVGMKIPAKLNGKVRKCPKCGASLLVSPEGVPSLASLPLPVAVQSTTRDSGVQNKQRSGSDLEIVLSSNETAQDVFRQVALRSAAGEGGLGQHGRDLEQARLSLGLSSESAECILQEIQPLTPASLKSTVHMRQQSTVPMPGAGWFVQRSGGGQYGPLSEATIRTWIAEGRVTGLTTIWREGWTEWRPVAEVFPQWIGGTGKATPAMPLAQASLSLSSSRSASDNRNPWIPCLLSTLLPGLGQLYKGQKGKGFTFLFSTLVGYYAVGPAAVALHIWCVVDATIDPGRN